MIAPVLNHELASVSHRVRQSTVLIQGPAGELGSGVIWDVSGLIITNAHVVTQRIASVTLANGQRLTAHRIGYSKQLDLAALKVEAAGLQAADIGDASDLRVGQMVVAVGNPEGHVGATSLGIVAAKPPIPRWVQADIALAPGYSGGPLATLAGEVVGINTLITEGRGYAIPSALVQRFLNCQQEQPYLGITAQPSSESATWTVTQVEIDSPAARAGLVASDQILGINGRLFRQPSDLPDWLDCLVPDQTLALHVSQSRQLVVCTLTVGRPPVQEQAA
ncbi:trypsin-like peptidase domain-containing protein [Nodosilinea sp. FACHB-131]|uniref:S1C family serine protease n=1 Tax=Cyanophyceae TaxID=3028117 RepID=UPI0016876F9C|nr:trypsin-like peptidase domain-containing protein [Nodosilinea sp. FACHB-131]MBD1873844.1 trypsin-like peptidase domain-containing protein [Nodosilinea sp. FACHB-131]